MEEPHENDEVTVSVPLLKTLILFAEAASDVLLSDSASKIASRQAHQAAEEGCRVILDQGFRLDG